MYSTSFFIIQPFNLICSQKCDIKTLSVDLSSRENTLYFGFATNRNGEFRCICTYVWLYWIWKCFHNDNCTTMVITKRRKWRKRILRIYLIPPQFCLKIYNSLCFSTVPILISYANTFSIKKCNLIIIANFQPVRTRRVSSMDTIYFYVVEVQNGY